MRDDKTGYWQRFISKIKRILNPKPAPKPVPPKPVPQPAPIPSGEYVLYRIITDMERDGHSRTRLWDKHFKDGRPVRQTPQTVRIHLVRENGKAGPSQFALPGPWQDYVYEINSERGGRYVTAPSTGWVNKPNWPVVQALLFRNNIIPIERIEGKRAYIKHALTTQKPPAGVFLHNFTVVTYEDTTIDPPPGTVLIPLVFPMDAWIEVEELVPA